jgi:acyl carrier protein
MNDIELKKIFLQVFPDLEESEFDWKKKQNEYTDWDSFAHLNLITLVEEKFDISISDDNVIELKSAEMILNFIERNK